MVAAASDRSSGETDEGGGTLGAIATHESVGLCSQLCASHRCVAERAALIFTVGSIRASYWAGGGATNLMCGAIHRKTSIETHQASVNRGCGGRVWFHSARGPRLRSHACFERLMPRLRVGIGSVRDSPSLDDKGCYMAERPWIELEFQALRQDMMMLADAAKTMVTFCLPAAAVVYAVPVLLHQTSQPFLWALCAGLASLLLAAMVQAFCSCLNGGWKIGTYIKEVIEPQTNGGLQWEGILFDWEQRTIVHTEAAVLAISTGALIANLAAAVGVGVAFLSGWTAFVPAMIAGVFAIACIPAAWRTSRVAHRRKEHSRQLKEILQQRRLHETDSTV